MKTVLASCALLMLTGCAYITEQYKATRAANDHSHVTGGAAGSEGTPMIPASECIGAVVNGVCHGTPSPDAQIRSQTGQLPRCHGTMVSGQCTGPVF